MQHNAQKYNQAKMVDAPQQSGIVTTRKNTVNVGSMANARMLTSARTSYVNQLLKRTAGVRVATATLVLLGVKSNTIYQKVAAVQTVSFNVKSTSAAYLPLLLAIGFYASSSAFAFAQAQSFPDPSSFNKSGSSLAVASIALLNDGNLLAMKDDTQESNEANNQILKDDTQTTTIDTAEAAGNISQATNQPNTAAIDNDTQAINKDESEATLADSAEATTNITQTTNLPNTAVIDKDAQATNEDESRSTTASISEATANITQTTSQPNISVIDNNIQTANADITQAATNPSQIANETSPQAQGLSTTQNPSPVLRLEDTIRANTEQPQVLTIVPWQLPVHQRINEDKQWQLQVAPMAAIERNAFLKNLNVIKTIEAASSQ